MHAQGHCFELVAYRNTPQSDLKGIRFSVFFLVPFFFNCSRGQKTKGYACCAVVLKSGGVPSLTFRTRRSFLIGIFRPCLANAFDNSVDSIQLQLQDKRKEVKNSGKHVRIFVGAGRQHTT